MQTIGHIVVKNNEIKVLIRYAGRNATNISMRLRTTGSSGQYLSDESDFLESRPDITDSLLAGNVIDL